MADRNKWFQWAFLLLGSVVVVAVIGLAVGSSGGLVLPSFDFLLPNNDYGCAMVDLAQVKMLTEQCLQYKIDNNEWPPNLEALTLPKRNGGPPYLDGEAAFVTRSRLGEKFRYDVNGPHNRGLTPDIWIDGPHGTIGNWMKKVP